MARASADANTALNATQGALLGFLHDGPRTGWDLLDEAARGLQRFWNVTSSHVYRELKALEGRGFIKAGRPGPRDRRPYAITPAGRAAFASWIAQEPGPEQIRLPLLVTLWFGAHLDDATLARFVEAHRTMHETRLAEYRDIAARTGDQHPHLTAVLAFGISYEEAFLRWLVELPFGRERARVAARRRT